ncbi:MAG: glycosyl hydrolase family 18 protein [Thalassotalea sp.]|nr:glycosyl hydrolase family 18 protein [Thalassotalea sp.]
MNITISIRLYFLLLCFSFHSAALANIKVVGYLPAYNGLLENAESQQLKQLTHLNIAFLNPDKSGQFFNKNQFTCTYTKFQQLLSKKELIETINIAQKEGVLVSFSIGGAIIPKCGGNWQSLLLAENRKLMVGNLLQLVDTFNLDGIDIDLESQLLTSIKNDGNFVPFIQALSKGLKARNKILSAATGSYVGGMIPIESLPYFDYVSLMSYDAIGPTWGNAGVEHATIEQSNRDIKLWLERGLKQHQLVLGVPFYGYGFGKFKANYTFAQIIKEFGKASAEGDLIGEACSKCDYVTYNGTSTLIKKTNLAMKHGSGVMIWELTHDNSDELSLLNIINKQILKSSAF